MVQKLKACDRCNSEVTADLVKNITASGVSQVYWYHMEQQHGINNPLRYIAHELLRQYKIDIENLPVINDYRSEVKCSVSGCENNAVEYNHWAPRHIFKDEADNWPGGPLCKYHHDLWHALVTPDMPGVNKKVGEEWKQKHNQPISSPCHATPSPPKSRPAIRSGPSSMPHS